MEVQLGGKSVRHRKVYKFAKRFRGGWKSVEVMGRSMQNACGGSDADENINATIYLPSQTLWY
jgi:hypothetical protein